ncbi:alpha/beta fold hydrolase [Sneathiella chungangensis]|uniref:Alpha/beta fold hydrolase n=1 Tax=Sneathiella chungangensis TaxID=1418234 RepID=A0A845MCC4_9PROT|nr:alpha/beta hydrolase [Sneathiella chungangensis]MZR20827.1 alpha/beta fold hydrolase [Sneathiella chungangensis]
MTAIHHKRAELTDISLHYAECGAENDELVLMLHGFPEFWYCWKDQLPVVGEKYHAVAPDMRGYNLSDKPEGVKAYRIGPLVRDMIELADHFGKESFYLVAHDWGAAIAYAVAIAHPERIKGLMILNGAHPYIFADLLSNNDEQIANSQYMAYFRNPNAEAEMLANNGQWLLDWTFREIIERGLMTEEDADAYRAAWAQPGAMTAMVNYYRASPLVPATKETKGKGFGLNPEDFKVHVPTFVLWGEADHALIKENLVGLENFIDDLTIKRLPGITHWVTHEAPEIVSAEILAFIDRIRPEKAS